MKNPFPIKRDTFLGLLFSSCFLVSFVGGCAAKLTYEVMNHNPMWLNTVVVAVFGGLFLCSAGFMGLLASRKLYQQDSFASKTSAVLIFLFYCITPMLLGLFVLQIALKNLINLL